MKKALSLLLATAMAVGSSVVAFAADSLTLDVGSGKTYATIEDAIAYAATQSPTEITYVLYDDQTITAQSAKYEPDLAQGADVVNVIAADGTSPRLTLAGVYYGRFSAEGAELNMEGLTLADARKASGEGTDPDPWEFCYLEFVCNEATFTDVDFVEGVLVSGNNTFERCTFTVEPQYYTETNGATIDTSYDYGVDHYALWLANTGTIKVNNCTFKDVGYGAIKSTYGMYGEGKDLHITVTNSTFDNCGNEDDHKMLNLDGADSVTVTGNTIINCLLGQGETEADKLIKDKSGKATITAEDNFKEDEPEEEDPIVVEEEEEEEEFVSVTAKILWEGKPVSDGVDVKLLKNDKKYKTETLTAGKYKHTNWRHTWSELDPEEDWTIEVIVPDGYECDIDEYGDNDFEITLTQVKVPASETVEEENPNTGAI